MALKFRLFFSYGDGRKADYFDTEGTLREIMENVREQLERRKPTRFWMEIL